MNLIAQRCSIHIEREAIARCPDCQHFFCAECVSEYEGRMLCATCLESRLEDTQEKKKYSLDGLKVPVLGAMAILLAWIFFYSLGWASLKLPDQFHEPTLYERGLYEP